MKQRIDITPATKQIQRLILSPQMQQSLHLLQLPVMELEAAINEEVAQNPLLEAEAPFSDFTPHSLSEREENDPKTLIENRLTYETSLYDHLMMQARMIFKESELPLAEAIIGNLDEKGFLSSSLEEIALLARCREQDLLPLLEVIQTFSPTGVGAQDLRSCLLIQLKALNKEETIAYKIVDESFEDMLKNRIPQLAKKLGRAAQEIYNAIDEDIVPLDLAPGTLYGSGHYESQLQQLIPDLHINYNEGKFTIEINETPLPQLRFNSSYLDMLENETLDEETRCYLQEKLSSGKWFVRNLQQRHHTLRRIGEKIVETQSNYLNSPKGNLKPMTMKEIAQMLELHESTIARAIAGKYLSCPKGIIPLRFFFTNAYTTDSGEEISSKTVKDSLKEIIAHEDKRSPLSDEAISQMIKEKGVQCARRTVAKYRTELGIGNTTQRKIHS